MWRASNVWLLVWVISLGIICCNLPRLYEPQYGQEYNEERKKLELPILPDHWKVVGLSREHVIWIDPDEVNKLKHRIPFHASKKVDYKSGTLRWEKDRYYGTEDYVDVNGDFQREFLSITYYYQVDGDNEPRWGVYFGQGLEKIDVFNPPRYSLEEAEQILKEWGIKRLNYE